ncbi:MAG: Cof-type HAD-IIB family hydrolase [Butyricicoccus pullicaecorum]|nr:Cof-type HAD-IIB family hydrolase [Butyricicoccus pullicaecorum]
MSCFDFVVTDLDGTLFYDRENICDRDRDALHRLKAQGIRCAIATGRELDAVVPALDRLNLWDDFTHIIHSGGAGVYTIATRENQMTGMLSIQTLCEIFDRYVDLGLSFVLPMDGKLYVSRRTSLLENEARLLCYPLVEVPDLKTIIYKPMNKIVLNAPLEDIDRALPILTADTDPRYQWHRSHDNYIDCYARGISKGTALTALCETLGIDPARTLAIGDNENDIQLLDAAGTSACPADGTDTAKAHADYVCCPAHEGAFADMCEHYIFEKD